MTTELASFEKLKEIVDRGQYKEFVWSEEEETPLLVDVQTANCLLVVYEVLSTEELRTKFKKMVCTNKLNFCRLVEFCWKQVK